MNNLLKSRVVDFLGGILLPLLCLVFDPFVFNTASCEGPLLDWPIALTTYSAMGLGLTTLLIWLISGPRLRRGLAFLAGILWAGAAVALLLGIILLPFSLIGLLIIFGIAGFTPFLTAFVFFRNGSAAWLQAHTLDTTSNGMLRILWVLLGVILVFGWAALSFWLLPQWLPSPPPYIDCPSY